MQYDAIQVGNRLQDLRRAAKISQKKMAEMLKVTQPIISKQEQGAVSIDAEYLTWYANFYGVSVDYILCRTDIPNIYVTTGVGERNATLYTTEKSPSLQEQEQALRSVDEALNGKSPDVSVPPELQQAIEQIVRQVLAEQDKRA